MVRQNTHYSGKTWPIALLSCLCFLLPASVNAQTNRITAAIDPTRMTALQGNLPAAARSANDIGLADPAQTLNHISINFKPGPAQQADLDSFLADQQNPASPNFHVWLTPAQYGDRFGLSSADLAQVVAWLNNSGFQVTASAAARNWVAFDGTVATVQRALHTEIHNYSFNGETHFANSAAPSVPAAIAPLVSAVTGLNDFRMMPSAQRIRSVSKSSPEYTNGSTHILAPDDLATIYDLTPLYNAGYEGAGQTLVIVGQSDITLSDITGFRTATGLPAIQLQQILVPGVTDPGHSSAETEADLDIEWSGAVARNARIVYVYAPDVFAAAQYSLSPPLGQAIPGTVVNMSFGGCEAENSGLLQTWQTLAQQGNAQGVTFIASSGDSGAAGCDLPFAAASATGGPAVSVPASVPQVTAVGGTEFNEGTGNYWSTTNSSTGASALSYIPETSWNESGTGGLAASGGGVSGYYSQPAWQTGVAGVPVGNFRAVPDLALSAAGHDGYFVVSSATGKPCTAVSASCIGSGTSVAAPSFAGMIVVLNQYATAKGLQTSFGQGNINPSLYRLHGSAPNAFHDITTGNNIVPCKTGSTGCTAGSYGYSAGVGYDMVTGLGSVDANNLITQWYGKSVAPTTTTVTPNPVTFTASSSVVLTATVTGTGGTPTGSVSFGIPGATLGTATLTSGSASLTVSGSLFALGTNTISAVYSGDSNFSGSTSTVTVTVNLSTSASAVVPTVNPNPVLEQGSTWYFTITLTETAGTATTLTGFSMGGVDYSAQIPRLFGTAGIPGKGSIVANMTATGIAAPATLSLVFSGVDPGGKTWTQSASASLAGPQATAALSLISVPSAVYQNPAAASNCQWTQSLVVQELNGYSVTLKSFNLAGNDEGSQIAAYFGSTQLNAFGSLQTTLCWPQITPPQTLTYQVGGVDSKGNNVTASASAIFNGAPITVSSLSVSASAGTFQIANSSQSTSSTVAVNVAAGVAWSVSTLPANQTTAWLSVSPTSGVGPANVTVTANGAGLTGSTATGTLTFQAPQALPSYVNLPVSLTIGGNPVVINAGGVVPVDSTATVIQPGSWASIYGANLAAATTVWNGNFPTSLGGVTVTVDNRPAYLWFVSAGQINFQVPADTSTGPVNVTVENSVGSATATVTMAQQGPAFLLLADGKHATGLIFDPNGGGSQGGGTYDLLGPTSAGAGFRPAKAGDPVVLYGIGFGPTNPSVPPGQLYSGAGAQLITSPQITVGGVPLQLNFAGIVGAGLYQFNFSLPANLASGDQPLQATVNGVQTPLNVFVPVQ